MPTIIKELEKIEVQESHHGGSVTGPNWSDQDSGRYAGRYPLAVERHVLSHIGRLLPGVTTVTPHARYYTLHAYVASQIEQRKLKVEAAQRLLRHCEVVMGAVSQLHLQDYPDLHAGLPGPHGTDKISVALDSGFINADVLAQPGEYAKPPWGFRNPYLGSELLMGLVTIPGKDDKDHWTAGEMAAGFRTDGIELGRAFDRMSKLASKDLLDYAQLRDNSDLCICQIGQSADGPLLRDIMLDSNAPEKSPASNRYETARMLLRIIDDVHPSRPNEELAPLIAFGDLLDSDPVINKLAIAPAWRGIVLRNYSVGAWRSLWALLINQMPGRTLVSALSDPLTELLPKGTLKAFVANLPDPFAPDGNPAPAEFSDEVEDLENGPYEFAQLLLGAQRFNRLSSPVSAFFEGSEERGLDLTPSWLQAQMGEYADQPVRDFAQFIVERLIARSQRIALFKSRIDRKSGTFKVPTRVFLSDNMIFRDSNEGGGAVGLRWNQLITVLGPLGLLTNDGDGWATTDLGKSYAK